MFWVFIRRALAVGSSGKPVSDFQRDIISNRASDVTLVMPPTSKKLEGHIASGLFVCPSIRPSVLPSVRPSVPLFDA